MEIGYTGCFEINQEQLSETSLRAVFNWVSKVISRLLRFLHYYALWFLDKTHATFSTNGNPNQNQSCFRRTRFPALGASFMHLLRILIGLLFCLHLLRLATVITLVLVLRHSIGNLPYCLLSFCYVIILSDVFLLFFHRFYLMVGLSTEPTPWKKERGKIYIMWI